MNNGEVIDLVSLITAYDGRNAGAAELAAWSSAAERGRWTYGDAADAVKAHYAESTDWLMPGHVTQRLRARRSEPPRSNALPVATPQPADDAHVRRVVDWIGERFDANRETAPRERRAALAVPCPWCGARAERACVQTTGRGRPRAGPLPIDVPHLQRRKAYREQE